MKLAGVHSASFGVMRIAVVTMRAMRSPVMCLGSARARSGVILVTIAAILSASFWTCERG